MRRLLTGKMVLYKEHTLPPLELPYVDPFVRAPLPAKL